MRNKWTKTIDIAEQKGTIQHQKTSIETLRDQLHLFRAARFGRKSEKGVVSQQFALQFDEAVPAPEEPTKAKNP